MLKIGIKEYIYQALDRLSDKYKTEYKNARLETEVKYKIDRLSQERDSKK